MKIPTGAPIDYMHSVCLGSIRSLHFYWKKFQMLNEADIDKMSQLHSSFLIPSSMSRPPQSFKEAKDWKASQWKCFLLHTGPIVLLDFLLVESYLNFLYLSNCIKICLESTNIEHLENAKFFFKEYQKYLSTLSENCSITIYFYICLTKLRSMVFYQRHLLSAFNQPNCAD